MVAAQQPLPVSGQETQERGSGELAIALAAALILAATATPFSATPDGFTV